MLNKPEIENIIKEFFNKTGLGLEIESISQNENTVLVEAGADDPKILIGQQGQTLQDIQHILKIAVSRKIKEILYLDLDINGYKRKKYEYLKELARQTANEVSLSKQEKALDPMPAYERRIVHLELADRSDVYCESQGDGLERRIVIKPKSQTV